MSVSKEMRRVKAVQDVVKAPVNSPASNRLRGERINSALRDVSDAMERMIDASVVNYFVPDIRDIIDRDAAWFLRMVGHVSGGGGVSQGTYARMVLVLARLPKPIFCNLGSALCDYDRPSEQPTIARRNDGGVHFMKCWKGRFDSEYLRTPFDKGEFPKRFVLLPHLIDDGQVVLRQQEVA
ncbi:hypothetical protein [Profundibacter sp.]